VVDLQVARDGQALAERLGATDPRVRARAAFALASLGDEATAPALLEALADPSSLVRADAALALGRTRFGEGGDTREDVSRVLLQTLATEPSAEVRRAILDAMGRVGDASSIDILARYADPKLSRDIAMALSRAVVRGVESEAAVERVGRGLTHADPEVRRASAYLLARTANTATWYGQRRHARLALRIYDKSDPAALWSIQGLGRSGDFWSRDDFREWARESPDWRIRVNALRALGQRLPDPETLSSFLHALDDPSPHVRLTGIEGMGEFALPALQIERIEEWIAGNPEDWRTAGRLFAILALNGEEELTFEWLESVPLEDLGRWRLGLEALAYLSGQRAIDLLTTLLESPHLEVSEAAMESLANRWRQDRFRSETHDAYWSIFAGALREGAPELVEGFAPIAADEAFRSRGSVGLLVESWERLDADAEVARLALVGALGEIGGPSVDTVLREALVDRSPAVREAAAEALALAGGGVVDVPSQVEADETRGAGRGGPGRDVTLPPFLGERIEWDRLRALGPHPLLHLGTERGTVVVRMDAEEAPQTVQTVAELARAGKYDGVPFHRVVANFVVQAGDYSTRRGRTPGEGDPGFSIGSELTGIAFRRGVIGMASSGRDTEGSQFFITHSAQPHLDGGYTAFGYVVEGMDVVDRILQGDLILEAWVEPGR
jgi:peptidylprolyl isomerase